MQNTNINILKKIWAKTTPFQSIVAHSLNTSAIAHALLTKGTLHPVLLDITLWVYGDRSAEHADRTCALVEYLASLHDMGKNSPYFQVKHDEKGVCKLLGSQQLVEDYCDEIKKFRHEKYSEVVLKRIWNDKERFESADTSDCTVRYFSGIAALHHQGKSGHGHEIQDDEIKIIWQQQQDILEEMMFELFRPPSVVVNSKTMEHVSAVCMQILGTIILSDWLASSGAFSEDELETQDITGKEYYAKAAKKADDLVRESRLSLTVLPEETCFSGIWKNIPKEKMRPLQIVTEKLMSDDKKPLLFLVEAPMGEGKTEAGAYAAFQMGRYYGKEGFYVALPTSATANQMYDRIRCLMKSLFPEKEVRLLHSLAWLMDESTREEKEFALEDREYAMKWTQPLRRGLLEGYSVGTIDQVLMAALYVKYGAVRLLGIGSKVLVLDEVHAYDAYMQDILIKLLSWCRELRVPVVMLSATLPSVTKQSILKVYGIMDRVEQDYPAITSVFEDETYSVAPIPDVSCKKEVKISIIRELNQWEAISRRAIHMVREGGCICILVNTVGNAQQLYETIKKDKPEEIEIFLFHAAFSVRRRQQIEKEVVNCFGKDKTRRPQKAILIATQVVEQSADVDFDSMITEIAPIDLLLQRMGRVFRHENTPRSRVWKVPELTILVPENGNGYGVSEIIYPKILLEMTQQYLANHSCIRCPESIREAVESVYSEDSGFQADLEHWMEYQMEQGLKHSQAKVQELIFPDNKFKVYKTGSRVEELFDDTETDSFLSAKTRLAEPTVQMAILSPELYRQVLDTQCVSKELAKEVYLNSVSVAERKIKKYFPDFQRTMLSGNGPLKHILILSEENGRAEIRDGVFCELGDEVGFRIWEVN